MGHFFLPDVAESGMLTRLTLQDLVLKLYKTDVTTGLTPLAIAALTEASFTEATFTGYTAKTLTGGSWTITTGDPSLAAYAQQTFTSTANQATQNIYGFILTTTAGTLRGVEVFDAPIAISLNGDAIQITPKLTLSNSEVIMTTGAILPYGGATAPVGYLLCDGSAVSRTTYAELFGVISTTYGTGDGSTTFNVPDLRGRFPLGKAASGTGSTLGSTGGTLDHTHSLSTGYAKMMTSADTDYQTKTVPSFSTNRQHSATGATTTIVTKNYTTGLDLGGSTAGANPPFIGLQYIIKI